MSEQRSDYAIRLTLQPKDVRVVLDALDLFMRLSMGQLSEIKSHFTFHTDRDFDVDRIEELLNSLKRELFPQFPTGASYGIAQCPDERARMAYDILQTLRHCDSWARMQGGPQYGSVAFDAPHYVTDDCRPVAEEVDILDQLAGISESSSRPKVCRRRPPTPMPPRHRKKAGKKVGK